MKQQEVTVKVYIQKDGQKIPLEAFDNAERIKIANELNLKALRALGYEVRA